MASPAIFLLFLLATIAIASNPSSAFYIPLPAHLTNNSSNRVATHEMHSTLNLNLTYGDTNTGANGYLKAHLEMDTKGQFSLRGLDNSLVKNDSSGQPQVTNTNTATTAKPMIDQKLTTDGLPSDKDSPNGVVDGGPSTEKTTTNSKKKQLNEPIDDDEAKKHKDLEEFWAGLEKAPKTPSWYRPGEGDPSWLA